MTTMHNLDAELKGKLDWIKTDLTAHDMKFMTHATAISSQVGIHDTVIQGLLGTTQATLDNEVEKRQGEG